MDILIIVAAALGGIVLGVLTTYLVITKINAKKVARIIKEAEEKAEMIKKDKMLQAKENFYNLKPNTKV